MARVANKFHMIPHYEDGAWWAEVDELPGCFATGDDFAELVDGLAESITIYLGGSDGRIQMIDEPPADPDRSVLEFEYA